MRPPSDGGLKTLHILNVKILSLVNCATVSNGEIGFCHCNTCGENEGDCDAHDECQDGLFCGSNNCQASLGFDAKVDCCYQPTVGDEHFCTTDNHCAVNEGDCDFDNECQTGLICKTDIDCSSNFGLNLNVDCCQIGKKMKLK